MDLTTTNQFLLMLVKKLTLKSESLFQDSKPHTSERNMKISVIKLLHLALVKHQH